MTLVGLHHPLIPLLGLQSRSCRTSRAPTHDTHSGSFPGLLA